jgi:hypothetical protein
LKKRSFTQPKKKKVKREIFIVIVVDGFALPFNPNDVFKVLIEPQDVFSITNWENVRVILRLAGNVM